MAGKKKKTLANKLAKMSDEERARYLQHKAEIEEEARRRKEQLIASFMKKKIKKEDTFARLNMSKINQNWHQIMRKIKVNEMKLEVEQLKKWMEHTIEQKNLKIAKLMNELEEAEEQYLNNFYSHSTHLDTIIRNQHDNIEKLQIQYQEELNNLMFQAKIERNGIEKRAKNEESYLKTLIYGQGLSASKKIQNAKEAYDKILYEVQYNHRCALKELRKTREETELALWKQILEIVRFYVRKNDVRRSHLQELRKMDADNAEQVRNNEETILRNEELVKILHEKRADLMKLKSDKIKSLETEEQLLQEQYGKNRRQLRKHVILDEKQLGILTTNSNQVLDDLEKIFERGCQIIVLSQACRKFETERETIAKWLPIFKYSTIDDGWTDDEKLHLLEAKSDDSNDKSFVKKCYLNLEKLENFWAIYNKAEVDVMELKQEKVALIEENQHLKTLIRNFLEAAALCRRTSISTTRSAPHIGRSALKNH